MEIEMLLQDALQDATLKFRDKIKDFNSEINKKTQDFIANVQEQCAIFHESIKTQAIQEQIQFTALFEAEDVDAPDQEDEEFNMKLDLFGDKDVLVGSLDTYKEFMESRIGQCEKNIRSSITKEW